MTPTDDGFDSSVLLSHVAWVKSLARDLVPSDRHLAEDLAQDACLAALHHRPSTELPLAAWLGRVVRNLARERRRGESRRRSRETDAARVDAQPSTLDIVEKVAAHREVVEAVLTLEEPYRTTILLRFYEERSPGSIARMQGIPVATVKTRLARGLERLRAKLDRSHGSDGRGWLLALVPLVDKPGGTAAATLGTLLVSTNLKIAIAALAAVGGAAILWSWNRSSDVALSPALAAEPSTGSALEGSAVEKLAEASAVSGRSPEAPAVPAASATEVAPAAAARATVHGRVLDLRSRAVSGVQVWFSDGANHIASKEFAGRIEAPGPDSLTAVSQADGRFEFALPETAGSILCADPKLSTVLAGLCGPTAQASEAIVVVAPRIEVSGRVVAEDGRPLEGARVLLGLPAHFRKRFPEVLDASEDRGWVAHTDARGLFELADAPQVEGAQLSVHLDGWLEHQEGAPQFSVRALEIVLRRPGAEPGSVSGQVVDPDGRLVPDARVALGANLAKSDERGAFTMRVPEGGAKSSWTAVKRGYLPAIEAPSPAVEAGTADGTEFVVLKLGPPPPAIEGRVVDRHGKGVPGIRVWPADLTYFGRIEEVPTQIEGLLAGAAGRTEVESLLRSLGPDADPQAVLMQTATVFWPFVKSDGEGGFRIEGLLDRDYALVAMDPDTLLRTQSEPIRAGKKNVEVVLDVDAVYERIAGKVLSSSGAPVPNVTVSTTCDAVTTNEGSGSRSTFHAKGKVATTDSKGQFVILRVPKDGVYLRLDGEDILPLEYGRGDPRGLSGPSHGEVETLELRVELRYHFQVELSGPEAKTADEIKVLDADDQPVPINLFMGNSRRTTDTVDLKDGKSDALVVPESVRTLVLLSKGAEVRRITLHLVPGELNIVRP